MDRRLALAMTCTAAFALANGPAAVAAQDWIGALTELAVAPADLRDARSPIEQRIALAEALGRFGPKEPALAALRAALDADPEPPLRLRAAIMRAIALRDPAHAPAPLAAVLASVNARAARAAETASLAASAAASPEDATRELALRLRAQRIGRGEQQSPLGAGELAQRAKGLETLAALPRGLRKLALRALARDPSVIDELKEQLASEHARTRAYAAQAAQWLGDERVGPALVAAFERETDPEALRAQAAALPALAYYVAPAGERIERALCEPVAAPDVLALLYFGQSERRVLERLRAALAGVACEGGEARAEADDPRVARLRANAASGLGAARDPQAVPALRAALQSPFARVRLAAAVALQRIGTRQACEALAFEARIEPSALRQARCGDEPRLAAALVPHDAVLQVRVPPRSGAYDIQLPDGAWRRVLALPTGELIVPDLPAGLAHIERAP